MTTTPPPESDLDRAILAHRADPTDANRERVLALQRQRTERFYRQQADDFIRRTR